MLFRLIIDFILIVFVLASIGGIFLA